jgi:hypothetical protein
LEEIMSAYYCVWLAQSVRHFHPLQVLAALVTGVHFEETPPKRKPWDNTSNPKHSSSRLYAHSLSLKGKALISVNPSQVSCEGKTVGQITNQEQWNKREGTWAASSGTRPYFWKIKRKFFLVIIGTWFDSVRINWDKTICVWNATIMPFN